MGPAPPPPPTGFKSITQLSLEYPVSCGQQHQRKEEMMEQVYGKFEPVKKKEEGQEEKGEGDEGEGGDDKVKDEDRVRNPLLLLPS